MNFDIDIAIVLIYLLGTIIIGFLASRNVTSIRQYAVGDQNFSMPLIVATIFATWVGGESTIGMAEQVYKTGIVFILVFFGSAVNKIIIAYAVAPKIDKFRDCLSAAEIIGTAYGTLPRIITGILTAFVSMATVAAQLSAIGYLMNLFLGIDLAISIITGGVVIALYSASGGVKAVTVTDVFQFAILIIALPIVCSVGIEKVGGYGRLIELLPTSHLEIFPAGESPYKYVFLMIIFSMPFLNPAIMQRMLIAKSGKQIANAMKITALIEIPFYLIIGVIGLVAFVLYPSIDPSLAMPLMIKELLPHGIKGFVIAGVLAVIMSTVDSFINSASVSVVHDVINQVCPLSSQKTTLYLGKFITFILGILAIFFALRFQYVFDAIVNSFNFWAPMIVVPLYAALYGVRAHSLVFILGAATGLCVNVMWFLFSLTTVLGFSGLIPAIIANGVIFFLACNIIPVSKKIVVK